MSSSNVNEEISLAISILDEIKLNYDFVKIILDSYSETNILNAQDIRDFYYDEYKKNRFA